MAPGDIRQRRQTAPHMPLKKWAGLTKQRHLARIAYFPVTVVKPAHIGRQIHRGRTCCYKFIATVQRRGYRFLAPVRLVESPELTPAGEPIQLATPPLLQREVLPLDLSVPTAESPIATVPTPILNAGATVAPVASRLSSQAPLIGERKQVTVLYADIHDMQVLLGALDPEVVQQLLEPALHTMLDAVQRYGGTAPQVADDGVMALFGAPVAYEDHAVRACHAALAMQAALRTYADDVRRTHDLPLQCRMGLNAGEVVMRAVHHAPHREYSLIGQTTYLAERLMQVALPDTILLTAFTARLVAGLVGVKALPPLPVPGFAEPVEVYALLETSGQTGVRDRGSAIWHIRTCQAR
jgi:class 3 adenylate cyclase